MSYYLRLTAQPQLFVRLFHSSIKRRSRAISGRSLDPISNIRPAIPPKQPPSPGPQTPFHPYSLDEFDPDVPEYELQWRLHQAQVDSFNHEFWKDNNLRFEAEKSAVLDALPESATPLDREKALSEFYARWLAEESARHDAYTKQWRKRSMASIVMGINIAYKRLVSRLSSRLSFK